MKHGVDLEQLKMYKVFHNITNVLWKKEYIAEINKKIHKNLSVSRFPF